MSGPARMVATRLADYSRLMRLDRPIGIWLLLWPTLWGLWFAAGGAPDRTVLLIFIGGVVLMRSAGCVINDAADRDFDRRVTRTRDRPVAAGRVSRAEAIILFVLLGLAALLLVLQTNRLTIVLSVPALLLAATYPLAKRWHGLPQAHLGLAFAWSIPMGFAAQTGTVGWLAWPLMGATVLWTVAYDTFYAMADRDEDLHIGVKSSAILFGDFDRPMTALLQLATLLVLWLVGASQDFGVWYGSGLAVAAVIALRQQWMIRYRDPDACFAAFLDNHWFGAAVLFGLVLETWPT